MLGYLGLCPACIAPDRLSLGWPQVKEPVEEDVLSLTRGRLTVQTRVIREGQFDLLPPPEPHDFASSASSSTCASSGVSSTDPSSSRSAAQRSLNTTCSRAGFDWG